MRIPPLWLQILAAIGFGIIAGLLFGEQMQVLQPLGDIFIRMIRMIIVPLIFAAIVSGLTSIHDPRKMSRVGLKAFGMYLLTTTCAVTIGLAVVLIIAPGVGGILPSGSDLSQQQPLDLLPISALLTNIFPSNPIASMAEGNMLQIIVFSILIALATNAAGDAARPFKEFMDSIVAIMIQLTGLVMRFAPIGVFALMAAIVGQQGLQALLPLAMLLLAIYLGCFLQMLLTYGTLLKLLGRLNPASFYRKIIEGQLVAFTTSSSAATMPVTLRVTEQRLGVSHGTASFVIPLGMTVNMDGSALNFVIGTIFVAQVAGIDLTLLQYGLIMASSALISIGTAGVPGAAASGFLITLGVAGLPLEGMVLIIAVERLADMIRTAVNVTGDAAVAVIVDHSEQSLDIERYNAPS